jgi:hypothetical protein
MCGRIKRGVVFVVILATGRPMTLLGLSIGLWREREMRLDKLFKILEAAKAAKINTIGELDYLFRKYGANTYAEKIRAIKELG